MANPNAVLGGREAADIKAQIADNAALLPPPFDTAWYKTGLYYDAAYPYYTTIAPTTGAVGVLYLCKHRILDDVTFNQLSVNLASAAASSNVFYGVYASDASGLPSTLLASGSASGATTGVKSTAATLVLTKGQVVWDAFLTTGASLVITGFRPIFQGGASPTANGFVLLARASQTSLPADVSATAFISVVTSILPRVELRVA